MSSQKHSFFYRNGLSIVVLLMMFLFWSGQYYTGWKEHNSELEEENQPTLSARQYITSGHFVSATFENWESEFLQMALYVILTVWLRQKGSSESKKLKGEEGAEDEEVDREPKASPHAPWPVRKGGIWLALYKKSLFIVLSILFILSFWLHFAGSHADYNEKQLVKGKSPVPTGEYLSSSHFWFESFQNWQSEFLAVGAIVLLSIWFRQKGSPQSKPVDAPYSETGSS